MKSVSYLLSAVFAAGLFHSSAAGEPIVVDEPRDESILESLRIVEDADGHSNLRAGASLKAAVTGKVLSGGPVFVDPDPENGFHMVFVDKEDGTADRYLHASRLKPVKGWKAIGPEGSSGVLKHAGFEAKVKRSRVRGRGSPGDARCQRDGVDRWETSLGTGRRRTEPSLEARSHHRGQTGRASGRSNGESLRNPISKRSSCSPPAIPPSAPFS